MILGALNCSAQEPGLDHMNSNLWKEDIDFLNQLIQSEFKSFYPDVKKRFDEGIQGLLEEVDQLNNHQVMIKLMQLTAGLRDGHTEVQIFGSEIGLNRLPLIFYFFQEGLYIVGAHEEYNQYIGQQVTHIGGEPVSEVVQKLKTVMPHDNDYEILHAGTSYLLLPSVLKYLGLTKEDNAVKLTLTTSFGDPKTLEIEAKSIADYQQGPWKRYHDLFPAERPISTRQNPKNHWYEYTPEHNAMYFYFGTVNDQKGYPSIRKTVKRLFAEIDELKPQKLIIDLRKNRGGNYHKSRHLIEAIKKRPWLNQEGRIFAISGRTTFSAAMVTTIFLKKETNTLLVGEPSRGHPNKTDNVEHVNLPNSKLRIEYTTRIKKHWKALGEASYVPLDIVVPVTFKDFSSGFDPVLDLILRYK